MEDIYCYSYVEDAPSAAVAKKLVAQRNSVLAQKLHFRDGFPAIMDGYSAIKKNCPGFLNMARGGLYTFSITDLDTRACAGDLIRDWFSIPALQPVTLPKEVVFRVAVREVEAWIMADRHAWARYIGIPAEDFPDVPDVLPDPKQHLLNIIQRKGMKKLHKEMLPSGTAHIGPRYNEVLCDFVSDGWSPSRAAQNSPSLKRAIDALRRI